MRGGDAGVGELEAVDEFDDDGYTTTPVERPVSGVETPPRIVLQAGEAYLALTSPAAARALAATLLAAADTAEGIAEGAWAPR